VNANHNSAKDYRALAALRYEIRRFLNFSEQAARKAGVEPHQHQALLAVKGLPEGQNATIGVLAERLQVRHHSAVEMVNRMEKKGLIRRSRNQKDQREVQLTLSPRGEKILKRLTLTHRAELRATGPKLLAALSASVPVLRRTAAVRRVIEAEDQRRSSR